MRPPLRRRGYRIPHPDDGPVVPPAGASRAAVDEWWALSVALALENRPSLVGASEAPVRRGIGHGVHRGTGPNALFPPAFRDPFPRRG